MKSDILSLARRRKNTNLDTPSGLAYPTAWRVQMDISHPPSSCGQG